MNRKQPGNALDRFHAAVMADPAAQQMLAEQYDPAQFEVRALEYAAARGIALTVDALFTHAPRSGQDWPDAAWLPVALSASGVDWVHFASTKPDQPFFEDSVRAVASRPFNRLFRYRTPLEGFIANAPAALPMPRGLIFHMSRCGSTLVAQMLGAAPGNVALAEASPLDSAIPFGSQVLCATAAALGRGHANYFLKTDAWHTRSLPLIRRAFPKIPWIFLYRNPVEVLASHARMPGRHVAPGIVPALDGLAPGTHGMDHAARILALLCEAAVENYAEGGGLLVNHTELPDAVFTRILPHFGVTPSVEDRALMRQAGARDAKAPSEIFRPDSTAKRQEGSEDIHIATRHLAPIYAELEAIRAASLPAAA